MLSVFVLLARKSRHIKSLQLPIKYCVSEQAFAMIHLKSQTFEMILPSWWCNLLTMLICKLARFPQVGFLLEGSRRWPDNETTTVAGAIRNRRKKNTVPHQICYLKTFFIQAMFTEYECISSPTPWFLFRQFQTHLGATSTLTEHLILASQ